MAPDRRRLSYYGGFVGFEKHSGRPALLSSKVISRVSMTFTPVTAASVLETFGQLNDTGPLFRNILNAFRELQNFVLTPLLWLPLEFSQVQKDVMFLLLVFLTSISSAIMLSARAGRQFFSEHYRLVEKSSFSWLIIPKQFNAYRFNPMYLAVWLVGPSMYFAGVLAGNHGGLSFWHSLTIFGSVYVTWSLALLCVYLLHRYCFIDVSYASKNIEKINKFLDRLTSERERCMMKDGGTWAANMIDPGVLRLDSPLFEFFKLKMVTEGKTEDASDTVLRKMGVPYDLSKAAMARWEAEGGGLGAEVPGFGMSFRPTKQETIDVIDNRIEGVKALFSHHEYYRVSILQVRSIFLTNVALIAFFTFSMMVVLQIYRT